MWLSRDDAAVERDVLIAVNSAEGRSFVTIVVATVVVLGPAKVSCLVGDGRDFAVIRG